MNIKTQILFKVNGLNFLSQENKNICCVGDDDQSIYSWRGAEIKNFLEFDKVYNNTKIIRLEKNYDPLKTFYLLHQILFLTMKIELVKLFYRW